MEVFQGKDNIKQQLKQNYSLTILSCSHLVHKHLRCMALLCVIISFLFYRMSPPFRQFDHKVLTFPIFKIQSAINIADIRQVANVQASFIRNVSKTTLNRTFKIYMQQGYSAFDIGINKVTKTNEI